MLTNNIKSITMDALFRIEPIKLLTIFNSYMIMDLILYSCKNLLTLKQEIFGSKSYNQIHLNGTILNISGKINITLNMDFSPKNNIIVKISLGPLSYYQDILLSLDNWNYNLVNWMILKLMVKYSKEVPARFVNLSSIWKVSRKKFEWFHHILKLTLNKTLINHHWIMDMLEPNRFKYLIK